MNLRLTNSIFAFLFLFQSLLFAQDNVLPYKAGVVNVQEVFKSYYKTVETQADIDQERARIKKEDNDAKAKLKELQGNVQRIHEQTRAEGLPEEEVKRLVLERNKLSSHHQGLDRERDARFKQANAGLDRQMRGKMRGILEEIKAVVTQHAEKENFTIIFEKAGTNTNQVTPMLYGKDLIDITAVLMVELNKNRPADQ